jgi:hypothetical protein
MTTLIEKLDKIGLTVTIWSYYGPYVDPRLTGGKKLMILQSLNHKIQLRKIKEFVYS